MTESHQQRRERIAIACMDTALKHMQAVPHLDIHVGPDPSHVAGCALIIADALIAELDRTAMPEAKPEPVEPDRPVTCPKCNGAGNVALRSAGGVWSGLGVCPLCAGKGILNPAEPPIPRTVPELTDAETDVLETLFAEGPSSIHESWRVCRRAILASVGIRVEDKP